MNIKNCTEVSVTIGERTYCMHLPEGANHVELFQVAYQILEHSTKKLQEITAAAKKAIPQEIPDDKA